MELRVLNYFLAIAREENITRAAEQLHVTQPTLSRQIADLEAELGVKLFTRSNHNIVLTEDGMLLKRRAQEILTLADKTKRDFLNKEENLEGTVTIGSGEFLSTRILTDCIAAFRNKYPNIRYEVFSGNAGNIKDGIELRLALSENETSEERMSMLRKKRNGTLDEIHFKQRQLDRLDYLRYEISRAGGNKRKDG